MLYLSGIILSFFLSFVLITKRNKTHADYILAAWLGFTGLHFITYYLLFTNQQFQYPALATISFSLPLIQGPFLYIYTVQQTSPRPFDKKQLLHFIPVLLSFLLFGKFYMLPEAKQIEVFRQKGKPFETQLLINLIAVSISGVCYVILSLRRLLRYRKAIVHQFSNTDKINFNWLLYLIIWIGVIWSVVLFLRKDELIYGSAVLFIIWVGYFGIKQVNVFSQHKQNIKTETSSVDNTDLEIFSYNEHRGDLIADNPSFLDENINPLKYQKSNLKEEEAILIHSNLKKLLEEQKLYKNPDLTLNELANSLNVHPNHLSQVINSLENKNFHDLINEKRVDEFLRLIAEDQNQQFTLLSLAYECGFNSKASFNRNFKKITTLSPTEYMKQGKSLS